MTVWLAPDRAPTAGPPAARQAALRPGLRRRSRSGAAGRLLRGGTCRPVAGGRSQV